ncbi:hypothetical protein RvY_03874 [Ramazzottius varieornatus]|uniref:Thyrotropin-releasing hormone receptor n=1 Tax=Ramazzottius varieornatus TaxID=947166 RepID=A0A1D1UPK1_RAMVA|nr:hypothetical protein RvY_03874 [Ramazzottius varieornatus]
MEAMEEYLREHPLDLSNLPEEFWQLEETQLALLKMSDNDSYNSTLGILDRRRNFPLSYRIAATLCHTFILILGVTGNCILIYVVRKVTTLQSPTYCYLVALAFADLLVIVTVVPEAILYNVYECWLMGPTVCATFIYLNFVSINVGSLSILAFTIERFIAICYPLQARKVCSIERTIKIIKGTWIFGMLYCSPWLGLASVRKDLHHKDCEQCEMSLTSKGAYIAVFGADLLLFYVIPLVVAIVVYAKIGKVLYNSLGLMKRDVAGGELIFQMKELVRAGSRNTALPAGGDYGDLFERDLIQRESPSQRSKQHLIYAARSRVRVLRMLVVIVILFAIAWLPYRGLLVYNTFVDEPWLDVGYMFFAKTLIYLNSAINPFLYNAMSRRFRGAMCKALKISRVDPVTESSRRNGPLQTVLRFRSKDRLFLRTPPLVPVLTVQKAPARSTVTSSKISSPVKMGVSPKDLHEEMVDLSRCHYVRYCPPCRNPGGEGDPV